MTEKSLPGILTIVMGQHKQSLAQAIQDIRTNLYYQADFLRREFDAEEPDRIAKRLDRLRWDLKRYTDNDRLARNGER